MSLSLPPMITELLKKLAGDRDVETFIADITAERLDPPHRVKLHLKLGKEYLNSAEDLYVKGDLA